MKEHDDFFYWACVVLDSIGYSLSNITDILIGKDYSCGKTTVHSTINRFKQTGSPLQLKRGRPRESGIGKCSENCIPVKIRDGNFLCTHKLAEERTYEEVAEKMNCSVKTVFNRVKAFHTKDDRNQILDANLNAIFDDAEENEKILSCSFIRQALAIRFNFKISLESLYVELRNRASFRCPTAVPFLTLENKKKNPCRVDYKLKY